MTDTIQHPVVLTADAVRSLPASPFDGIEGVTTTEAWRSVDAVAGVLTIAGGHRLGSHAHRRNHHHLWVLEGGADVLGTVLGPGGYAHVPAGSDRSPGRPTDTTTARLVKFSVS